MSFLRWIMSWFTAPAPDVVVTEAPKKATPPARVHTPVTKKATVTKKADRAPEPKMTKASLSKLTKAQLEAKGREFGIEVDKRKKKDVIVTEVINASKKK